jgi:mRNA interferase RelE/StbE
MAWSIDFDPRAKRELKQIDPQVSRRLSRFLFERISPLEDPRSIGQALKGTEFGDL